MRKYILFTALIISALRMSSLLSCPCEFSPEDKRPFFEQYETETNIVVTPEEKEESS